MRDWSASTALVVEDSPVQREHMAGLLRQAGFREVLMACDGIDALRQLRARGGSVELVVTDLDMPGMDGVDLLRHLARRDLADGVVVASAREQRLEQALAVAAREDAGPSLLGAARKPVRYEDLLPLLDRAQDRGMARRRAALTVDALAAALAAGHIQPFFQPKVDIATGVLRGVEALARWLDPVQGVIAPSRFLPAAEGSPLNVALALAVARQGMERLRNWHGMGLTTLNLSINLPASVLGERAFIDALCDLAGELEIAPRLITWDITEAALHTDQPLCAANLAHLSLRGYGVALDDYGVGYASVQQLARCPLSELKIDRPFVHEAARRPQGQALLREAIDTAHRLGALALAEGIELEDDWSLLRALGCDLAQGELLGAPMPAPALVGWLRANRQRLRTLTA